MLEATAVRLIVRLSSACLESVAELLELEDPAVAPEMVEVVQAEVLVASHRPIQSPR